ncbi:3-keto-disaccharide hydrolase [Stutzerimonas tarimensis]|uniref:DUF1080 domain-containing protein n=1 Tax=Stutzerimonas tarimensis TaxID=1507735 RepID=A0ABV7T4C1_9GAMM
MKRIDLGRADWRGWRSDVFPEEYWRVEGEELVAVPEAGEVDLVSQQRYRDFIFDFEFALPAGGNSGVLYRVTEVSPRSWQNGPEMQLLDDARHPDGNEPSTRNGALYGLLSAEADTSLVPGHFVQGRVQVCKGHVEHWLDGRCVLAYRWNDPALRQRILGSKFGSHPGFACAGEGFLVLQHHGDPVRFRHLSVTLLV